MLDDPTISLKQKETVKELEEKGLLPHPVNSKDWKIGRAVLGWGITLLVY
jgi:hypothetical protein